MISGFMSLVAGMILGAVLTASIIFQAGLPANRHTYPWLIFPALIDIGMLFIATYLISQRIYLNRVGVSRRTLLTRQAIDYSEIANIETKNVPGPWGGQRQMVLFADAAAHKCTVIDWNFSIQHMVLAIQTARQNNPQVTVLDQAQLLPTTVH